MERREPSRKISEDKEIPHGSFVSSKHLPLSAAPLGQFEAWNKAQARCWCVVAPPQAPVACCQKKDLVWQISELTEVDGNDSHWTTIIWRKGVH